MEAFDEVSPLHRYTMALEEQVNTLTDELNGLKKHVARLTDLVRQSPQLPRSSRLYVQGNIMSTQFYVNIAAKGITKDSVLDMLGVAFAGQVLIVYVVEGSLFEYDTAQLVISSDHHVFLSNALNALHERVVLHCGDILSMQIHDIRKADDYTANAHALLQLHKQKTGSYAGARYVCTRSGEFSEYPVAADAVLDRSHAVARKILVMTDEGLVFL